MFLITGQAPQRFQKKPIRILQFATSQYFYHKHINPPPCHPQQPPPQAQAQPAAHQHNTNSPSKMQPAESQTAINTSPISRNAPNPPASKPTITTVPSTHQPLISPYKTLQIVSTRPVWNGRMFGVLEMSILLLPLLRTRLRLRLRLGKIRKVRIRRPRLQPLVRAMPVQLLHPTMLWISRVAFSVWRWGLSFRLFFRGFLLEWESFNCLKSAILYYYICFFPDSFHRGCIFVHNTKFPEWWALCVFLVSRSNLKPAIIVESISWFR